jgi:hypothetical protein
MASGQVLLTFMTLHGSHLVRAARPSDMGAVAALAGVIWRKCYPGIISPAQIRHMHGALFDGQQAQPGRAHGLPEARVS